MATAPRPGSLAAAEGARKFIRLKVLDDEYDLMPSLSIQERFVVRAATSMSFETFLPRSQVSIGEDSLFVLWWVARRQNGEPTLPFAKAEREWPPDLKPGDLELSLIDLDDEPEDEDSPEGSGPG